MPIFFLKFLLLLSWTPHLLTCTPILNHHRRILHQPFFPLDSFPPTQPPSSSPQRQPPQPKFPFSSSSTPKPFFPSYPSPPPPPSSSSLATFPANISSLVFPQSPRRKPISGKLHAVIISSSLASVVLIASFAFLIYRRRHHSFTTSKTSRSDSHRLFPANTGSSDVAVKVRGVSNTSSEFLYLGTLVNSRGIEGNTNAGNAGDGRVSDASPYQKLGSPELHPLPPLSRQNVRKNYGNAQVGSSGDDEEEEEKFYSPRGSTGGKESLSGTGSSSRRLFQAVSAENFSSRSSNSSKESLYRSGSSSGGDFPAITVENFGRRISESSTPSYPSSNSASPSPWISKSASTPISLSPRSLKSKLPDSVANLPPPPPPPRPTTPSPQKRKSPSPCPPCSPQVRDLHSPSRISNVSGKSQQSPARLSSVNSRQPISIPPPPSPPPPPPPRFWEASVPSRQICEPISKPPVLVTPSRPVVFHNQITVSPTGLTQNSESEERSEETPKPKLKPLHWDKVRASSDRAMVWDQLKSSSFQLNEEMIETLFMVNGSNTNPNDRNRRSVLPVPNQENRVLDPKKSQNIAILLRALNVTIDEVCEALLEGNADTLGTELLESLLKMAPTKEEERKLKEYKDDSPFKLGPAERFLKAVLDIPFAFKRVDAMLYIANFDSEVEYLRKSFETLEAACEELRNSRMFLKLLEAVLKTGNRMNVGTNRGDAQAFKLDTLLKLVDVKGTDGKTTLLHFVVQEIIRTEGSRLSGSNQSPNAEKNSQSTFRDDVECRKRGLQVVAGLSGDLTNVKKAAAMDSDVLSSDVSKLASGIGNISEVARLNEEALGLKESSQRFSGSMNGFLKMAAEEIIRIQAQESVALSLVKEITEYFHGNSAKEEAHPFRIFMVVRDFLSVLDKVCKEVGKINERTIVSSARQFPVPVNPTLQPVFPIFHGRQKYSSSDEESSSS